MAYNILLEDSVSFLSIAWKLGQLFLFIAVLIGGFKLIVFLFEWEPKTSRNSRDYVTKTDKHHVAVSSEALAAPSEAPKEEMAAVTVENIVFRRYIDGKPVDMGALHQWIADSFLPQQLYIYDWFALWRLLRDNDMFDKDKDLVQAFADQMNEWFPKAQKSCSAGEVNRFKRGYLGETPHAQWNRAKFLQARDDKQTRDGYDRLDRLYISLAETFDKSKLKS